MIRVFFWHVSCIFSELCSKFELWKIYNVIYTACFVPQSCTVQWWRQQQWCSVGLSYEWHILWCVGLCKHEFIKFSSVWASFFYLVVFLSKVSCNEIYSKLYVKLHTCNNPIETKWCFDGWTNEIVGFWINIFPPRPIFNIQKKIYIFLCSFYVRFLICVYTDDCIYIYAW